jgi:acetyl/propionyl-CoA carboxylase alpha subunit
MEYVAITEDGERVIELIDGGSKVMVDGQVHSADMQAIGNQTLFSLLVDNGSYEILIEEQGEELRVLLEGKLYTVRVQSKDRHRLSKLVPPRTKVKGKVAIRAPIPGVVASVPVTTGQAVSAGDLLLVLESMKMENELRAPQDGVIQAVNVAAGDLVHGDQVLLVVE